mgnify:CR=1 FL=1
MKVTIYTTPSCQWCARTKEFFRANKIKYDEVDVAANQRAAEEMVEKSGQMGVPVTKVDGQIIVGFDEPRLRKALKLK